MSLMNFLNFIFDKASPIVDKLSNIQERKSKYEEKSTEELMDIYKNGTLSNENRQALKLEFYQCTEKIR